MAGTSQKTAIIAKLFFESYEPSAIGGKRQRYDRAAGTIPDELRVVYIDEVAQAYADAGLSLGNKFAFFKDLLRKGSRGSNWPKELKDLGWTAIQETGSVTDRGHVRAKCFRFLPYQKDQKEPFPDEWPLDLSLGPHLIQSVTLSIASKQIDRLDEARLMQLAVELRIVETHFALYSPLSKAPSRVLHIDHVQTGMKLAGCEIDGLFRADYQLGENAPLRSALITVEAKREDEFVNSSQIVSQVRAVATRSGIDGDVVVPVALKHRDGGMHLIEFADVPKDEVSRELVLRKVSEIFYKVEPPILGLASKAKRPPRMLR